MAFTSPIPGVTLRAFKQDRELTPEDDGFVGQLYSGYATVLAVTQTGCHPTIGIFRDGSDKYYLQKDWLMDPGELALPDAKAKQERRRSFATAANINTNGDHVVFGVRIPLRVLHHVSAPVNSVHYPENMLMLAQYRPDGTIAVYKVALISQDGVFFLTAQQAYDLTVHKPKRTVTIPRVKAHRTLHRILIDHRAEDLPLVTEEYQSPPELVDPETLPANTGIVDRWYDARNLGRIITNQGPARAHWSEVQPSPRRRHLMAGDRVQFDRIGKPPSNQKTEHRRGRRPRFKLQVFGVRRIT